MKRNIKIAEYLRYISRSALIVIAGFGFVFALLSGSEEFGGGLKRVILNIPNTLLWLLLFIVVYIAWKWEFIGGLLIALFGIFTIYFFHTYESYITLFLISLLLIIIGIFLLAASCLKGVRFSNRKMTATDT